MNGNGQQRVDELPLWLRLGEVMRVTGLSKEKVWELRDRGHIRVLRTHKGGYARYWRDDVVGKGI